MLDSTATVSSRRNALRRAVRMECTVLSTLWDDTAPLMATDLSPFGLWLGTGLALDVGEEVVLSFRPPGWPEWGWPVTVLAEVARVNLPRRRGDRGASGMGLRFVDLDGEERERMMHLLHGLPPPLPPPRQLPDALMLVDGIELELTAEAPLLTAGRPLVPQIALPAQHTVARSKHRSRRRAVRAQRPQPARRPHLRLVS
jgi:hypothetical protein